MIDKLWNFESLWISYICLMFNVYIISAKLKAQPKGLKRFDTLVIKLFLVKRFTIKETVTSQQWSSWDHRLRYQLRKKPIPEALHCSPNNSQPKCFLNFEILIPRTEVHINYFLNLRKTAWNKNINVCTSNKQKKDLDGNEPW